MKRNTMKKLLAFVLAVNLALCVFLFAACGGNENENALTGKATIVIQGAETISYEIDLAAEEFTTKNTVLDLIVYLSKEKELYFKGDYSSTGIFLTSIGSIKPVGNEFICVFTSVQKDFSVADYATEITHDGVLLKSADFGVSSLSIEDGAIFLFKIIA